MPQIFRDQKVCCGTFFGLFGSEESQETLRSKKSFSEERGEGAFEEGFVLFNTWGFSGLELAELVALAAASSQKGCLLHG